MDNFLQQQEIAKMNFDQNIKFEHFFMIIKAAKQGMGVGLVPEFLAKEEIARGELVNMGNIIFESGFDYYTKTHL